MIDLRTRKYVDIFARMGEQHLLTPEQAAELLQISVHTLASWRRADSVSSPGLPWIKVGQNVRYNLVDVQAWLSARTFGGEPA